jgi:hypothetical protein
MPKIRATLSDSIAYSWQLDPAEVWLDDAKCGGMEPAYWDPDIGTPDELAEGKRICSGCPVASDCVSFGFEHHETAMIRDGIFFGDEGAPRGMVSAWGNRRGRKGDETVYGYRTKVVCPECRKTITRGKNAHVFKHRDERKVVFTWCPMSGVEYLDDTA